MNGLSKYYIRKIINCFASELTATETSRKLKINRNTVNKYYRIIRGAVVNYQEIQYQIQYSPINAKQYCFSWHRNRGLIPTVQEGYLAFLMKVSNGRVYVLNQNTKAILEKVANSELDSPINWLPNSYMPNTTIGFNRTGTARTNNNKIDTAAHFFMYAKEKLTKFYGVKEEYTYMYLKELEFRFNNQSRDLSKLIWKILPHHSPEWVRTNRHRR